MIIRKHWGHPITSITILLLLLVGFQASAETRPDPKDGLWETWSSESYTLQARESFQFPVAYDDIPARRWRLVVNGGDTNCDLSVLRMTDESLVYFETNETLHEVSIPWGEGEELIVVITNRNRPGAVVVAFQGPPKDQAHASYSFDVNRALEKYAAGQRLEAENYCRKALLKDEDDAVAKVLLAGFLRDRNEYSQAAGIIDEALVGELNPGMREVAEGLRKELDVLRAPQSKTLIKGIERIENHLENGDGAKGLAECENLLKSEEDLKNADHGLLLMYKGRSMVLLDRHFEAIDVFTQALSFTRPFAQQAIIYFHMGALYDEMGNLIQAEGAYTVALKHGLPVGLDVKAREALASLKDQLHQER
jgi:hypothetical protein